MLQDTWNSLGAFTALVQCVTPRYGTAVGHRSFWCRRLRSNSYNVAICYRVFSTVYPSI